MPPPSATYLCGSEEPIARVLCVLWYICFPFVLLYHSLRIYVLPCCISYALGACGQFWLLVGEKVLCLCNCACSRKASVCCCYEYDDAEFPPTAASVGQWKNKSAEEVDKEIEWKRGNQICSVTEVTGGETDAVQHVRLFSGKIEPSDIGQGQLGDCWLMTALACLSEFPGAIQNIFETVEYNPRGRYVVKLYCGQKRRWEPIVVDDWIPVKRGTDIPIFAKPNGKELWVALLEKAFAKFVGNYYKLDGGFAIWGLQAMTGDQVANWMLEDGVWKAYEIRYRQRKGEKNIKKDDIPEEEPFSMCGSAPVSSGRADRNDIAFYRTLDDEKQHKKMQPTAFFDQLCEWDEQECVIAASTSGKDEGTSTAQSGLVQGHAYSVIECKKIEDGHTYRMLKVRNPWGSFEWEGDWCDDSEKWRINPKVKEACHASGKKEDDGIFWMCWEDFQVHFQNIDVCHRSKGIDDIRLDIHEDSGCIGPTKGCVAGMCEYLFRIILMYYCCCKGPAALCCPTDHKMQSAAELKERQKEAEESAKLADAQP